MYIFNIFLLIYETISKIFDNNLLCCWNLNEYKIRFTLPLMYTYFKRQKKLVPRKLYRYGFKAEFK